MTTIQLGKIVERPNPPPGWFATLEGRNYWHPILREWDEYKKAIRDKEQHKASLSPGIAFASNIIKERGDRFQGAINPVNTIEEIKKRYDSL